MKESKETLKCSPQQPEQQSLTNEILAIMESRRQHEGSDNDKYKKVHQLIRWKEKKPDPRQRIQTVREMWNSTTTTNNRWWSKVRYIKNLKNEWQTGLSEEQADIHKVIDDNDILILLNFYNSIYKSWIIPKEWLRSFITLPKKHKMRQIVQISERLALWATLQMYFWKLLTVA